MRTARVMKRVRDLCSIYDMPISTVVVLMSYICAMCISQLLPYFSTLCPTSGLRKRVSVVVIIQITRVNNRSSFFLKLNVVVFFRDDEPFRFLIFDY